MTSFLVGSAPQTVTYDRRVGKYRDGTGKFVSRATVLRLVDQESDRLATRMKAHARLLTDGRIDIPEFQKRAAEDLKLSAIRSTILGSGGRSQATNQAYGSTGRLLREQYQFLDGFARDLAAGKLSKAQAIQRASLYGASTRSAFHTAEKIARGREGFIEAKRSLDPSAAHCPQCLSYSTSGQWKPLNEVTMPTVNCECSQFCRCLVIFRKRLA
ncbi:hypothetical protein [Chroococcidiopsis sp.]|uniref:hypothetical protein n=1 Tax=Chroococcidiopsis sp. TaxID=3088168 RepID=UPI003F2D8D81